MCRSLAGVGQIGRGSVSVGAAAAAHVDGEALQLFGRETTCKGHDRAGIETAREEGPDRDIRYHLTFDCDFDRITDRLDRVLDPHPAFLGPIGQLVVSPLPDDAMVLQDHRCARLELAHAGEHGPRCRTVHEGEVLRDRYGIDGAGHGWLVQQGLQFAREDEALRRLAEVERLYALAIAGDEELSPNSIPDHECENAIEALKHLRTVAKVEMQKDFGIRMAAKYRSR